MGYPTIFSNELESFKERKRFRVCNWTLTTMRMCMEFPRNSQLILLVGEFRFSRTDWEFPGNFFTKTKLTSKIYEEFHSNFKKKLFGTDSELIWDACELWGNVVWSFWQLSYWGILLGVCKREFPNNSIWGIKIE